MSNVAIDVVRITRSQWIKLRRPILLWGTLAAVTAVSVLSSVVSVFTAGDSDSGGQRPEPGGGMSVADLTASGGLAQGLSGSATLLGVVALCVFAAAIAGEYSQGTLRNLLVRQPKRMRLLGGIWLALAGFGLVIVAVATVASAAASIISAGIDGMDISQWATSDALGHLATTAGNTALSTIGWGSLGVALGVLFRSAVPAIAVGVAYALPVENILSASVSATKPYLPGQLLGAIASGGSNDIGYARALITIVLYAVVVAGAVTTMFRGRDVVS
jgi:ABC-type transport system involved in multi-copper enzyme maturation permease subunit